MIFYFKEERYKTCQWEKIEQSGQNIRKKIFCQ